MQDEAVSKVCERLRKNAQTTGLARGRIILPCATGKSRIALRIIEQLTEPGEVSAILCPSIALVAQLRGEFLMHSQKGVAALAVCSDQTAARGDDLAKNQAADLSQTSARDVKGTVTTDADEISAWIGDMPQDRLGVIFGTLPVGFQNRRSLAARRSPTDLHDCRRGAPNGGHQEGGEPREIAARLHRLPRPDPVPGQVPGLSNGHPQGVQDAPTAQGR